MSPRHLQFYFICSIVILVVWVPIFAGLMIAVRPILGDALWVEGIVLVASGFLSIVVLWLLFIQVALLTYLVRNTILREEKPPERLSWTHRWHNMQKKRGHIKAPPKSNKTH